MADAGFFRVKRLYSGDILFSRVINVGHRFN